MVEVVIGTQGSNAVERSAPNAIKITSDSDDSVKSNKKAFELALAAIKNTPKRDEGIEGYIARVSRDLMGFIAITAREKLSCNGDTEVMLTYLKTSGWRYNTLRCIKEDIFGKCNTMAEVDAANLVWQKQTVAYFSDNFWKKVAISVSNLLKFAGGNVAVVVDKAPKDHKAVLKKDGKRRPVLALDPKKLPMDLIKQLRVSGALLPNRIDAVWQDSINSNLEAQLVELNAILETRFAYQYGITD